MSELIRQSVLRMQGYTPGEQPGDIPVIKLNTNENPYPPSPHVAEAIRDYDPACLRLYPDPVARQLREAIANLHGCSPDQVFVGNGSDEVLALCTRAFVEHDGTIGFFDPSYSLYPVLAEIREAATCVVPLGEDFGWPVDLETSEAVWTCALFMMTLPNAPTGLSYDRETVRGFCERMRGVVVLDEAYVDFADGHGMALALERDNVLVARTLSKSYSLAGLRLGYAVGSRELIQAMDTLKDSYNLNGLSQVVGLAAIQDQAHMRANVARIKLTRTRLSQALSDLGCEGHPSQTNFLWVRPAQPGAAAYYAALRERGILVRYFSQGRTADFLRITVGTDDEIDHLLAAWRDI